ncbi:MAG: CcmD family protein [Pseudomonadota bacterium]|jgi:CcmD family protein
MRDMIFVFAAFSFLWTGTLLYVLRLSFLRKQLEERIDRLDTRMEGEGETDG